MIWRSRTSLAQVAQREHLRLDVFNVREAFERVNVRERLRDAAGDGLQPGGVGRVV